MSWQSSPASLPVSIDAVTYKAPQTFNWPQGSTHTLSVTSPQSGGIGTQYVFSSWSDGGGQTHSITTPASATTYTANFKTQYLLTTAVNPSGAGSVTPAGYYDAGSTPSLSATPNGNYVFGFWSGDCSGTNVSTSVSMSAPRSCTANFSPSAQITVTTSPPGKQIIVDLSTYTSPYIFNWAIGSNHTINVTSPQPDTPGTRYVFSSWSDAQTQSHTIVTPSLPTTYTANFTTQYQLATSVAPPASGSVSPDCTGGCWYNSGSVVSLSPVPAGGNTFSSWSGYAVSLNSPLLVILNGPKNFTANFDTVPVTGTVRILWPPAVYYNSITAAYAVAASNNVIEGQAMTYGGPITFNRTDIPGLSLTLKGGYNATYSDNTGMTTVGGPVTIETGTITLDNVSIQ